MTGFIESGEAQARWLLEVAPVQAPARGQCRSPPAVPTVRRRHNRVVLIAPSKALLKAGRRRVEQA